MKFKIIVSLLGLFLALFISEVLLRITGLLLFHSDVNSNNMKAVTVILCIGDSSTYGVGASDKKKFSYPHQLQNLIRSHTSNKSCNVINLGVPGINSSQALLSFEANLIKYKPEIVIVMVGINDTWNLEDSNILDFYNGPTLKKIYLQSELILSKLRIYQLLKLVLISNDLKRTEKKHQVRVFNEKTMAKAFVFSESNTLKSKALCQALTHNITKLRKIAEAFYVKVLFMKYHDHGWGNPEKVIDEIYLKYKYSVIDNKKLFKKASSLGLNVRGEDGWHPNDLGYLMIAKNVYNKLVSLELITGKQIEMFSANSQPEL